MDDFDGVEAKVRGAFGKANCVGAGPDNKGAALLAVTQMAQSLLAEYIKDTSDVYAVASKRLALAGLCDCPKHTLAAPARGALDAAAQGIRGAIQAAIDVDAAVREFMEAAKIANATIEAARDSIEGEDAPCDECNDGEGMN